MLQERRFANETAARFGYAVALLRDKQVPQARAETEKLRAGSIRNPMIDSLHARVLQGGGDRAGAIAFLKDATVRYTYSRPLMYAHIGALLESAQNDAALALLKDQLRLYPGSPDLLAMQAKAYGAVGKRLLQHQAQAEVYLLHGNLPASVEQLVLAQNAGDGSFYELSAVEARLKELRARAAAEAKPAR